jgi:hypothetical protein
LLEDPLDAIVLAHCMESKSVPPSGTLGNLWAFLCDEAVAGASDPTVLRVGLLFQESLDEKLSTDTDGTGLKISLIGDSSGNRFRVASEEKKTSSPEG